MITYSDITEIYQRNVYRRPQRFRDFYRKAAEWAIDQGCILDFSNYDVKWQSEADKLMFVMRYM